MLARTGRSILHELSDEELVRFIVSRTAGAGGPVVEQDRWTIWMARKPK